MTKPDVRISQQAFEQMIETFSFLEEDVLDIYERVAISHRLLETILYASKRSVS
ncbi:hypothetical protein [[Roseibacterium] beibuensis]|uniref:Uncharacterized protein n=1 Tax=[Roseibacterium] beibuensis TaxID=1193142 RepID=A0ABP9LN77_9RHOB|nr:hypothetical protein [Roseibacterium beibuensis]